MARKILLADDSVTAQNMGRKILSDAGYEVVTVNNGSAAMKRISDLKPDLVVLDVYMPGYSGLEVCQRLKDSPQTMHIPVLLTVGKLEPFKPEEARRVGADAHIVKPFEASELLRAITRLEERLGPQAHAEKNHTGVEHTAIEPAAVKASAVEGAADLGGERFNSAPSGRQSQGSAGDETGWKSRLGFPSKKKKEEAEDTASGSFHDFRKDNDKEKDKEKNQAPAAVAPAAEAHVAEQGASTIPDIPRDITPEELDALSALAAKLDGLAGDKKVAPLDNLSAHAAAPVLELDASMASGPVAKVQEFAVEGTSDAEIPAEHAGLTVEHDRRAEAGAVEMESRCATNSVAPEAWANKNFETPSARVATTVNVAPLAQEAACIDRSDEPFFFLSNRAGSNLSLSATLAEQRPDEPAPTDADLAQALRLLTPSNSPAQLVAAEPQPTREDKVRVAERGASDKTTGSTRWVAEPIALSSQESAVSLEEEMFRMLAAKPAAMSAVAGAETGCAGGFSAITAAVEQRLAASALTNVDLTNIVEGLNTSEAFVANAGTSHGNDVAAASPSTAEAVESGAPSTEAGTIASIVDSVLADLRPKLMAEISKKLAGR